MHRASFLFVIAWFATACGPSRPAVPPASTLLGEIGAGALYAVDWPTSMRTDLEAAAKNGLAVVRYGDDGLHVLGGCYADGAYRVESVSPKDDVVRFSNRLELTTHLPLSGAAIAARADFEAHSENVVDLAVVTRSRWTAPALSVTRADLHGECAGATHVVSSIQRGAFAMAVRNAKDTLTAASVFSFGASGKSASESLLAKSDGSPESCRESADRCDALLEITLRALGGASAPLTASQPGSGWVGKLCDDLSACSVACDRGDMGGCTGSAALLLESDPPRAQRYARTACEASFGHGCLLLGIMNDPVANPKVGGGDRQKAVQLYVRACELGSLDGCQNLAYFAQPKTPFRADDESMVKLTGRACEGGDAKTCLVVAGWYAGMLKSIAESSRQRAPMLDAYDQMIHFHGRYCEAADAETLKKSPCELERLREARARLAK